MRHRFAATALAAILTAGLTACGSDAPSSDTTSAPTAAETDGEDSIDLNLADIEFAQGMIAHHEQAIEMAEMALDPTMGASAAVLDLASRIKAAQDPEIDQMTDLLTAAGQSLTMDMSDGHDMSSMPGMMSAQDLDAMAMMTGEQFDRMWLEMMIEHHRGAIVQAEAVVASGANAEVLTLAAEIIEVQQAEIREMQALLGN